MGNHPLAIALIAITVLYLIVIGFLFWRYRISMRRLADKLRECREKEQAAQSDGEEMASDEFAVIHHVSQSDAGAEGESAVQEDQAQT